MLDVSRTSAWYEPPSSQPTADSPCHAFARSHVPDGKEPQETLPGSLHASAHSWSPATSWEKACGWGISAPCL